MQRRFPRAFAAGSLAATLVIVPLLPGEHVHEESASDRHVVHRHATAEAADAGPVDVAEHLASAVDLTAAYLTARSVSLPLPLARPVPWRVPPSITVGSAVPGVPDPRPPLSPPRRSLPARAPPA